MRISDIAIVIGRTPDTLRRWEEQGLIQPERNGWGERVFDEQDLARCQQLVRYALTAQKANRPLREIVPKQLSLFGPR